MAFLKEAWPAYYPCGNHDAITHIAVAPFFDWLLRVCVSNPIIDCHASYFMLEGDPSLVEPRERSQRNAHGDYRSAVACLGLVFPLALDGWLERRHYPHRIHARTITQLFPLICLEERLVGVKSRWIYLNMFFFEQPLKARDKLCLGRVESRNHRTTWLCYPLWFAG